VISADVQLWKLSSGDDWGLGLSCTEDGLYLGGTALVERHEGSYAVRPRAELERLLVRAYGAGFVLDGVMPGFRVVAAALGERNLCLAQIAAVHLRMPDFPDTASRNSVEAEDRLIKAKRSDGWLARKRMGPG
jgi:hypothetical protein